MEETLLFVIYTFIIMVIGMLLGLNAGLEVINQDDKSKEIDDKIKSLNDKIATYDTRIGTLGRAVFNMEEDRDRDRKYIKDLDEELQDYFEWITELDLLVKNKSKTRKKDK